VIFGRLEEPKTMIFVWFFSSLESESVTKTSQDAPEISPTPLQILVQTGPGQPKTRQDDAKMTDRRPPKTPKDRPRPTQDHLKSAQDRPRPAQDPPRSTQEYPGPPHGQLWGGAWDSKFANLERQDSLESYVVCNTLLFKQYSATAGWSTVFSLRGFQNRC